MDIDQKGQAGYRVILLLKTSLQPLVKAGDIKFSEHHHTLIEQLERYPKSYDDGPDALSMLIKVAEQDSVDQFLEIFKPVEQKPANDGRIIGIVDSRTGKLIDGRLIDPFWNPEYQII